MSTNAAPDGASNKLQTSPLILAMADRFQLSATTFVNTVIKTVFPKEQASPEQLMAFLVVANEYKLNPFTKEIYAFPTRSGGIQPIVSIDGWITIINSHQQNDGVEFVDGVTEDGRLASVTCLIYRKDRSHPTQVTEYMNECRRDTDTWKKWPARMLRHKALIQCSRIAFGFSGIVDPDEADRIMAADLVETVERTEPRRKSEARQITAEPAAIEGQATEILDGEFIEPADPEPKKAAEKPTEKAAAPAAQPKAKKGEPSEPEKQRVKVRELMDALTAKDFPNLFGFVEDLCGFRNPKNIPEEKLAEVIARLEEELKKL